jgi:hypothetical protein
VCSRPERAGGFSNEKAGVRSWGRSRVWGLDRALRRLKGAAVLILHFFDRFQGRVIHNVAGARPVHRVYGVFEVDQIVGADRVGGSGGATAHGEVRD